MEKLKLHSSDLTQDNITKLAKLFPNCMTESRAEDGTLKRAIDFDQLRQELSTAIIEGPQERYQLNWPGKREALLTANAPIAKTLRPCREESVDFDTTQNLFIEGDNLDALKLLQETYLNKVKMIYIDPPYNTGSDFIYEDDFAEDTETYLERSNQRDEIYRETPQFTLTNYYNSLYYRCCRVAYRGDELIKMGIPLTHVKFYWTVFAKTHHAAPPQDLNASPAKWLFAALEARPVFRITGATCVKGIPILIHYQSQRAGGMSVDVAAMDAEAFLVRMYASQG